MTGLQSQYGSNISWVMLMMINYGPHAASVGVLMFAAGSFLMEMLLL